MTPEQPSSRSDSGHVGVDWCLPELGFESEIERLRTALAAWIEGANEEILPTLEWQFLSGSKYFRPLTLFACYSANHDGAVPDDVIRIAMTIELFHNMTLIVDDILDRSEERRGKATLHAKFGQLPALMASGYIVADAYRLVQENARAVGLLSELMRRLGIAECMQWRLRQQPLGVEDWRKIAQEDTGSMFEIAACIADDSDRLRRFGRLVGILYHGCDDVSDVRGTTALGGGGDEDIRDGILTLPAAIAIQNPDTASMFQAPCAENYADLAEAFALAIPKAERYLDEIAHEARQEAHLFGQQPEKLMVLVDLTRKLSSR